MDEQRHIQLEFIEPRFEGIPGVSSADTRGGLTRSLSVDLYPEALARHNLLPGEVVSAIRNNNVEQPGGSMVAGPVSYSVDRKSTRLNSSHVASSYAVLCLKKKTVTSSRT